MSSSSASSDDQFRPLSSTSISIIGAYSASSRDYKRIAQLSEVAKSKQKRKIKETMQKKKEKTKKVKLEKNRQKMKPKENWGSDWLTIHETTNNEEENVHPTTKTSPKLFSDLHSPEYLREVQRVPDFSLEPPLLQSLRSNNDSPEKVKNSEKLLIITDLPKFQPEIITIYDNEESDSTFRKENAAKKYFGASKRRKPKSEIINSKFTKQFVKATYPTATADKLSDDYVNEHPEETRQRVAPKKLQEKEDAEDETDEECHRKSSWSELKIPDGINDTRGSCNWYQRKRIRKEIMSPDMYKFPNVEDEDFARDFRGAPKMSLNQYLQKCRLQKQKEKEELENKKRKGNKKGWECSSSLLHEMSEKSDQKFAVQIKKNSRKIESELNESDSKRTKMAGKGKPTIRSDETLIGTSYVIYRRNTS